MGEDATALRLSCIDFPPYKIAPSETAATDAPLKFMLFTLTNHSGRPRRLSLTALFELVLGEQGAELFLDERFDNATGKLARGEELVVLARTHLQLPEQVTIKGRLGGQDLEWNYVLERDKGVLDRVVPKLWAAAQVERLLGDGRGPDAVRGKILSLGLEYGLMTPHTSFLALDSESAYARQGIERRRRPWDFKLLAQVLPSEQPFVERRGVIEVEPSAGEGQLIGRVAVRAGDTDSLMSALAETVEYKKGVTDAETTAEQALELDITELLRTGAPAGVADHTPSLVSLLRQNQGEPLEVELCRHDGEPFFAQILCIPLSDSEGAPLGTIAYVQDITQRKRIEEELGVQQARTQGIVNTAVDVILTVCDQGLIESANPAVRRLLGYEPEELVGQHVSVILVAGLASFPEEYLRVRPPSGEHRSVGTSREVTARARDGREIPVQTSVGEMRLGDRRVFAIIIHDLTDRKLLEMQFLQSQKMEAVGLLAGGVAHDFNNLLTAINGYSDLLLRTVSPTSSTYSMVQEIHLAGTRAVTLTRQLLAFSRKQVLAPVVLSLSRVVADMVKLLDRLVGEDVVLQTVLAENLWPCRADLGQLEQVIMNLAVNARDAMPGGGQLTLATSNLTIDDPAARLPVGEYVCLTVTDSGCGMDAATQARLFEPFFTTKEVGRGTGLGLATVYGIVKQSEGFILVDSALGRGTTFRVLLPRTQAVASPLAAGPPRRDSPAGAEVILLVEDEVSVRTMTQRLLQRGGYTVLSAGSASEAEKLFASHPGPVHLLLTDIVMPGPNGIELSTRLRRQRPELAVLYISGYAEGSLPARSALPAGAMLLAKPFSSDVLLGRVREVLVDENDMATGVVYFDEHGALRVQRAHVVILACNGVGTARLLLNSKSARFPQGLANSSGMVGKHLMFNGGSMVTGVYEHPLNEYKGAQVTRLAALRTSDAPTVAHFLLHHPEHRHVVRRVLGIDRHPYGEIRDNLVDQGIRPIDMLRCKLSFFGCTRFDPRSDLWLRITMFQGAPFPDDPMPWADDWIYGAKGTAA